MRGRAILQVSWAGNVLFAVTAVPFALGADTFEVPAVATALFLFGVSLVVWAWAFAVAVARSAGGDDVVVGNLFLLQGSAPRRVVAELYGSLGVCLLITVATASADPFGVLVPMLPLGLAGLWGARHGEFPARRGQQTSKRQETRTSPATRRKGSTGGRPGE